MREIHLVRSAVFPFALQSRPSDCYWFCLSVGQQRGVGLLVLFQSSGLLNFNHSCALDHPMGVLFLSYRQIYRAQYLQLRETFPLRDDCWASSEFIALQSLATSLRWMHFDDQGTRVYDGTCTYLRCTSAHNFKLWCQEGRVTYLLVIKQQLIFLLLAFNILTI